MKQMEDMTPGSESGTGKGKKLFENVEFDEEGRHLIMHHFGAARLYKLNFFVVLLFLGFSISSYQNNKDIFYNDWIGRAYIGTIIAGLLGLYMFSHR
mmetsp:Transcript_8567/g.14450  ORF Transcript_8567/g.14450 Transcript_8567/m.14450 type:complete len:97 (-) Transcript_8567:369-659(-)